MTLRIRVTRAELTPSVVREKVDRGVAVTFAMPLPSEANIASHEHWSKRHRRAANHVTVASAVLRTQARDALRLPCVVHFTRLAPQRLDLEDNLPAAFKHLRDGVALALGLHNDRDPRVTWRYAQTKSVDHRVRIEVRARREGPPEDVELVEDVENLAARVARLAATGVLDAELEELAKRLRERLCAWSEMNAPRK